MNNTQLILTLAVWLLMIFISSISPLWSRANYTFGIPLSPAQSGKKEISQLIRRFTFLHILAGAVCGAITITMQLVLQSDFYLNAVTVPVFIILTFLLHAKANKAIFHRLEQEMPAHAGSHVITVDIRFRQKLSFLRTLNIIPLLLIILNVFLIAWYYKYIPDTLPLHYNSSGEADSYGEKRIGTVFFFNLFQLLLTVLFMIVQEAIIRSRPKLHAQAPQSSSERSRQHRYRLGIFMNAVTILFVISLLLLQLSFIQVIPSTASEFLFFGNALLLILGAAILSKKGKAPDSAYSAADEPDTMNHMKSGDWKGGLFYANAEDQAIFVERNSGRGFTLNFGRPVSWLLLSLPILSGIILLLFAKFV